MEPRVAHAERRVGGGGHRPAKSTLALGPHRTTDVVRPGAAQEGDALRDVVACDHRVTVDPDNDVPFRLSDGTVEAGWHDPPGIVDQSEIWMPGHVLPDDLARPVLGLPIGDDDLHEVHRVILIEQRSQAATDESDLVADRHDDRDRNKHPRGLASGPCGVRGL